MSAHPTFSPAPSPFGAQSLLARAVSDYSLSQAWDRVRSNDGSAGVDGESIDLYANLQQLRAHPPPPGMADGLPPRHASPGALLPARAAGRRAAVPTSEAALKTAFHCEPFATSEPQLDFKGDFVTFGVGGCDRTHKPSAKLPRVRKHLVSP